jgi:hypothetical protein
MGLDKMSEMQRGCDEAAARTKPLGSGYAEKAELKIGLQLARSSSA